MKTTNTMLHQIGRMNILAISGGRIYRDEVQGVVLLPVRYGYSVEIRYDRGPDTYTVRRLLTRGGKTSVKAVVSDIYAEELGDMAYRASCYKDQLS